MDLCGVDAPRSFSTACSRVGAVTSTRPTSELSCRTDHSPSVVRTIVLGNFIVDLPLDLAVEDRFLRSHPIQRPVCFGILTLCLLFFRRKNEVTERGPAWCFSVALQSEEPDPHLVCTTRQSGFAVRGPFIAVRCLDHGLHLAVGNFKSQPQRAFAEGDLLDDLRLGLAFKDKGEVVGYQHSPGDNRYQECEEAILELAEDKHR